MSQPMQGPTAYHCWDRKVFPCSPSLYGYGFFLLNIF